MHPVGASTNNFFSFQNEANNTELVYGNAINFADTNATIPNLFLDFNR